LKWNLEVRFFPNRDRNGIEHPPGSGQRKGFCVVKRGGCSLESHR
jgi:hypothetical protein